MQTKLKKAFLCAIIVAAFAVLCIVLYTQKAESLQSFRKPDGTVVTLLQVSYSSNQSLIWGKSYQRSLYRLLPARIKSWSKASVFTFTTSQTNVPTFWIRDIWPGDKDPSQNKPGGGYQPMRLLDEYGCDYAPNGFSSGWQYLNHGRIGHYQQEAAHPHGKIVGLCIYDSEVKTPRLATFAVPGLTPAQMPENKQPLSPPIKDGEFGYQLQSFVTSLKAEPLPYVNMSNGFLFSQIAFRITTNGVPAPDWIVSDLKISDHTDKPVNFWIRGQARKDDAAVFNFQGNLDLGTGPFKLRAEFVHQTGFAPGELLTIKNVPFPEDSESVSPELTVETNGYRVTVKQVIGKGFTPRPNGFQPTQPLIEAVVSPAIDSLHMQLAGVANEAGEPLTQWGTSNPSKGKYYFSLSPNSKAKSMTLTFAVHESRFAEFEATPVVFPTNQPVVK